MIDRGRQPSINEPVRASGKLVPSTKPTMLLTSLPSWSRAVPVATFAAVS
jgi:hypothetical protein